MRFHSFYPLICMFASTSALNLSTSCSVSTVQTIVNGLGLNGTTGIVDFAYRLDSNATVDAFKTFLGRSSFQSDIPPVCAVRINGSTTAGSKFVFAALLPDTWNNRIIAATPDAGIEWPVMSASLKYGVAAIASNSGHDVGDMSPEWVTDEDALIDWGYRALHESTVLGKALVKAWYGSASTYNYLTGCSTGGRQAFKNVQTYPEDYDGVMAGAPAWWTTHQQLWNLKYTTYNAPQNSSHSIPESMFTVISDEVLKQCDPQDGLVDLVLSDPAGCNFNPLPLVCSMNKTTDCLTPLQLPTLYKIYNDWVDVNQTFVYSHLFYGSEYSWASQIGDRSLDTIESEYWYITNLLGQKNFTYLDLDYNTVLLAERLNPGNATADNFDLSPFYENGGKMLHWHGLSDAAVSPGASVYLHDHTAEVMFSKGIEIDSFYRAFFIPGLEHCFGTPSNQDADWYLAGPYQASLYDFEPDNAAYNTVYDSMLSLMAWVENNTAPDYMVTTGFMDNSDPVTLKHNRRICPYPQQAKYTGIGNFTDEGNWSCESLY